MDKKIIIAAILVVLFGALILFQDRVSSLLYFGSDEKMSDSFFTVPPTNVSSTSVLVPKKTVINEVRPVGIGEAVLPFYAGRDPGEIRPVPEEVKIFSEEQKNKLFSLITTHAKIVKESPNSFDNWIQLGILKKTIGDFEGARDAWEYVSVITPLNSVSFANLGELYWRYLHDYPKSEKNFLLSVKNKPGDVETYISLSGLYFYSYEEKKNLADDILFDGLKDNPGDVNLIRALASLYEKQKDYPKALEWWKKVLEREPGNQEVAKTIEDLDKKIGK